MEQTSSWHTSPWWTQKERDAFVACGIRPEQPGLFDTLRKLPIEWPGTPAPKGARPKAVADDKSVVDLTEEEIADRALDEADDDDDEEDVDENGKPLDWDDDEEELEEEDAEAIA